MAEFRYPARFRFRANDAIYEFTSLTDCIMVSRGDSIFYVGHVRRPEPHTDTERWMPIGNPADTKRQILHKTVSKLKQTN